MNYSKQFLFLSSSSKISDSTQKVSVQTVRFTFTRILSSTCRISMISRVVGSNPRWLMRQKKQTNKNPCGFACTGYAVIYSHRTVHNRCEYTYNHEVHNLGTLMAITVPKPGIFFFNRSISVFLVYSRGLKFIRHIILYFLKYDTELLVKCINSREWVYGLIRENRRKRTLVQ